MYTLIGSAKLNDVDPQAWLAELPQSRLNELLPLSFQPVAIGTVVEATKRLKLPVSRVLEGLGEHAGGNEQ